MPRNDSSIRRRRSFGLARMLAGPRGRYSPRGIFSYLGPKLALFDLSAWLTGSRRRNAT
nr:MAG TPA: hypothetical protein [Caudoviricetes sp.]